MTILQNLRFWDMETRTFQTIESEVDTTLQELNQREIDCSKYIAIPPAIDLHVHFREPGFEHKEDFVSGAKAALSGGVYYVLDMPNTNPITDSVKTILQKKELAKKQKLIEVLFAAALTNDNRTEIEDLDQHCNAYKIFMSESFGNLSISYENIEKSLARLEQVESIKPIFFHAEDPIILEQNKMEILHEKKRPPEAEASAVQSVLKWASEYPKLKFHITHVSSSLSLKLLELIDVKNVTTDTCTRYLYFNRDSEIPQHFKKVNPPLREPSDNLNLVESLSTGILDIISSDHSPHTIEEKTKNQLSGMPGVQELLPSLLTLVKRKEIGWERAIEAIHTYPFKLFNLENLDTSRNFVIVDMNEPFKIDKTWIKSKARWSPFENSSLFGDVKYVIKNNQLMTLDM
jgi:dihydroorotase